MEFLHLLAEGVDLQLEDVTVALVVLDLVLQSMHRRQQMMVLVGLLHVSLHGFRCIQCHTSERG